MEQWASYETRRVDIRQTLLNQIEEQYRSQVINSQERGVRLARLRLDATRELMKLEMPDRWSDITGNYYDGEVLAPAHVRYLESLPALTRSYLRRFMSIRPTDQFEGAECLYMIVMLACGDGEARTLFSPQDIGDVDGDGAPEFLDGWGRPIHFIRWPAGFVPASGLMTGDPASDADPFDHFRVDVNPMDPTRGYRLVPLIFSGGPSGSTGLTVPRDREDGQSHVSIPPSSRPPDPYARIYSYGDGGNMVQLATPGWPNNTGTDHIDNIHNHLIGGR
jgi:hypothetical protein